MPMTSGLYSSVKDSWQTPPDLFKALDAEFGFTLDAAASDDNHLCEQYHTVHTDGLMLPWHRSTFVNPPYGRGIWRWAAKALVEARRGNTVVGLLPCRTDAAWWHDYVMRATEIRLIRGRLRFSGAEDNAPFPSAVVVWRDLDWLTPIVLSTIDRDGTPLPSNYRPAA